MTHADQLRRALRAYDLAGPETPERADALAAVLSAAHGVCDQANDAPTTDLEGWPGSPAPELPTPLLIEVANLRRQLRDTQDELQRARYSPAEHWT